MAWRQQFTHQMNEKVMPEKVLFEFLERDYRDLIQQAQLEHMRTVTNVNRVNAGLITPQMAMNLLVDAEDLPREFLDTDLTPVEDWSDTSVVDMGDTDPKKQEVMGRLHNLVPDQSRPGSEAGQGTRATYATPDKTASKELLTAEIDDLLREAGYAVEG